MTDAPRGCATNRSPQWWARTMGAQITVRPVAADGQRNALSERIIKPKLSQGRTLLHGKTYFIIIVLLLCIYCVHVIICSYCRVPSLIETRAAFSRPGTASSQHTPPQPYSVWSVLCPSVRPSVRELYYRGIQTVRRGPQGRRESCPREPRPIILKNDTYFF